MFGISTEDIGTKSVMLGDFGVFFRRYHLLYYKKRVSRSSYNFMRGCATIINFETEIHNKKQRFARS